MLRRFLPIIAALAGLAPTSVTLADTVYFVSKMTGSLYSFSTTGTTITPLTVANTFPNATALAMGSDGNLYVGDATNGGSIRRFVVSSGSVSTVVTLSGSSPSFGGGPVSPAAIAFTPSGSMLVGRNPQSQFIGYPAGQVLEVVGWNGASPTVQNFTSGTNPNYQTGLAVAADGTLYASNTLYDIFAQPQPALLGDVLAFDASGAYQSVVAADGSGSGGLFGPSGLAVSGSSLFIASTMNGNIYRTDLTDPNTATNTTVFASTGGDYVGPLALLSDNSLLVGSVADPSGVIYRFDASGDLVNSFGGPEYGAIGGIVAVPEPATLTLTAMAAASAVLRRIRRRRLA